MKYPLIFNGDDYPEDLVCPTCKKNRVGEPHNFVVLGGGAFLLDDEENGILDDNLKGYLNLTWHGHHYEDVNDANKNNYFSQKVVKDSRFGQFGLYFCSTGCLRAFLMRLMDDFEDGIVKAKSTKTKE